MGKSITKLSKNMGMKQFLNTSRPSRNYRYQETTGAKTAFSPPSHTIQYKKAELMMKHEEEVTKREKQQQEKEAKKLEKIAKQLRKLKKQKDNQKAEKEHRIAQRIHDIHMMQEIKSEETLDLMLKKHQKAKEVIKENRDHMKQKLANQDLSYALRQEKAMSHIKSLDEREFRKAMETLDSLEDRQKKSQRIHEFEAQLAFILVFKTHILIQGFLTKLQGIFGLKNGIGKLNRDFVNCLTFALLLLLR